MPQPQQARRTSNIEVEVSWAENVCHEDGVMTSIMATVFIADDFERRLFPPTIGAD
jgi:hypothetical protein